MEKHKSLWLSGRLLFTDKTILCSRYIVQKYCSIEMLTYFGQISGAMKYCLQMFVTYVFITIIKLICI